MVNKLEEKDDNIFDIFIYKFIDSHIHIYKQLGLTPNMITTMSLISGLLTAYMITQKQYKVAGLLFLIQYYFDCADGKVARKYNMISKFGGNYDQISDIIKGIIISIVLYLDNSTKFKKYIIIIIILIILNGYHCGCQQLIYIEKNKNNNKKYEESLLDYYKKPSKKSCVKNMHIAKYFGPGTLNIVSTFLIFFWNYLP